MTDTSRRRVLNNAFQVLKPPCLQRVRCFAVVAAVFFIRGILNDPSMTRRCNFSSSLPCSMRTTPWCVASHHAPCTRAPSCEPSCMYRYTRTAASGEETQTGHVSICIVQYRETSIQPHVLNTEHMKAPGMQDDT